MGVVRCVDILWLGSRRDTPDAGWWSGGEGLKEGVKWNAKDTERELNFTSHLVGS